MSKVTVFKTVHEHAAGIDIGASRIFVSPDGIEVKSFDTFTSGYYECIEYLQEKGKTEAAMEATGVYWMALYTMLESCGIKVSLINPKETKQVKGRKTDVRDCRWIQKLFSAGILRSSFIPEGKYMEIRYLVRERLDIIDMGGTYVNKMQKCLELMNIKLKEVISQIHGVSGIKMIKAIIEGNRDSDYLLSLCDRKIRKNKPQLVLKALEANYNDTYLFILSENMSAWEYHQKKIQVIDKRIEQLLHELCQQKQEIEVTSTAKPIRHHAPKITDLHQMMVKLHGVNISSISGLNDYTLLRLIGETGVDMSRFPTVKNFTSWCGLTPKNHQTGKTSKRVKGSACNKAGQIFKECAQGLLNSKYIAIGSFMRKLKGRKDAAIAIKAGARKLAEAYYNGITKGIDYVEQGIKKYEAQLKLREISILNKLAKKHKMQLIEAQLLE
jgi:transposase